MKHEREMVKLDMRFQQNDVNNRFENSLKNMKIELEAANKGREVSLGASNERLKNLLLADVERAKPQKENTQKENTSE